MTATLAKDTIVAYFMKQALIDNTLFDNKTLALIYQQKNYTIEFNFFVDNFGGKLWISSQCAYRLSMIDQFYEATPIKRSSLNNFRERTVSLHNLYSGLDKMANDNYFRVDKDENFKEVIFSILDHLTKIIKVIIKKLSDELDRNLESAFHVKKPGVFDFTYMDEAILYSIYRPNELYDFLADLKKVYSQNHDEGELENYKILLKVLCDLHQFDYDDLEPRQPFWRKIRSAFAA